MTITSFPFDDQDSTEAQYSQLFAELQDTGILDSIGGSGFRVTPHASAMSLLVAPGVAYVRGHVVVSTAQEVLPLTPSGALTRYDSAILRLDPAANAIDLTVKEGTPGGTVPTLEQTDSEIFEEPLATAEVAQGAGVIAPNQLTDQRRYSGQRTGAWETVTRPASPRKYKLGFNATTGQWEFWSGAAWSALIPSQVADSLRWGGYRLTVSETTPSGSPDADRIWIQPTT
ncbi:hypothetical protein [Salinispora tropica]|uniref:Uncharacterized protein n=1 Tax=Salinispora tropica (strain ATCC BAA-916 / DSM 44818 / JCM 13857 / NBRC 105044 / CNB-440) TaxID=369723 RepID=A4X2B4_SALTO|nr:hypothetical protein [Salinispora tropica]ABP53014.1 hypothetical protein Strop_0530 [Salinispora tropica CNB-440]